MLTHERGRLGLKGWISIHHDRVSQKGEGLVLVHVLLTEAWPMYFYAITTHLDQWHLTACTTTNRCTMRTATRHHLYVNGYEGRNMQTISKRVAVAAIPIAYMRSSV